MVPLLCLDLFYTTKSKPVGTNTISALSIQGKVKVQGMGVFFLVMPLAQTWHAKHQYKELTYEIR